MSATMEYATKTQLYQRVKKPLLERQRRARINKCLDGLKTLIAEFQGDDAILRMDKAEMLETTITYMRNQLAARKINNRTTTTSPAPSMDSYRNGYMNAVNEVSRVMASTPGMSVELGRSVMTHLGRVYNRLQKAEQQQQSTPQLPYHNVSMESPLTIDCHSAPLSPASSGYHSDYESPAASPVADAKVWRPW